MLGICSDRNGINSRASATWQRARSVICGTFHRTLISTAERSETNISLDNMERLAVALEIDAWQLLKP
jgi:hypothetical protein